MRDAAYAFVYFAVWVLVIGWVIDRALALTLSIYKTVREFFK